MFKTKKSDIFHAGFFGKTNAGKSSLINVICNQDVSIVSDIAGTTTDPVNKRFELIGYGPINFIDTAGIDDDSKLGTERLKKTYQALKEVDLVVIVKTINDDISDYQELIDMAKKYQKDVIWVVNHFDDQEDLEVSGDTININAVRQINTKHLIDIIGTRVNMFASAFVVDQYLNEDDVVILVCPIDSEAPKGRVIAPQVTVLREALDNYCITIVIQPQQLKKTLQLVSNVKLVVTDSQVFKLVDAIVPKDILLTSFSILMANAKGDISLFIEGLKEVDKLDEQSRILVAESCSHNVSHEDIGQFQIPKLLKDYLGFTPNIDHKVGKNFPEMIEGYDFIIHCGSCMLNQNVLIARQIEARNHQIPITNYGLLIAYLTGVGMRGVEIFDKKN